MAGGIDWFRWHHGSVTDPKFQLVARKSGASLPDVLAVWAYVLEQASASEKRGSFGEIDTEALDCLFGFPSTETRTAAIMAAFDERGLIDRADVCAWEKRQPKRERDTDNSADRTRAYRERQQATNQANQNHVTPCDASDGQKNARGEERRVDIPPTNVGGGAAPKKSRALKNCPADFVLTDEMRGWAAEHAPAVNADLATSAFKDHTFSRGITDWPGAWRNWLRRDQQSANPTNRNTPPSFAQTDELARRKRWEEMTGRKWPTSGDVIEMETDPKRIAA